MAAAGLFQSIKEEVTCPICLELFRDPVTSECGHSFCRECIARLCQGDREVACPQCKEKLKQGNLRPNRELRNIVQLVKSKPMEDPSGGNLCERHRQPLQLYCTEDQTPICLVCRESRAHRAHTVVPVEEAVQEHRETIRQHLEGIESSYKKLHLIVRTDRTYLSQSVREEEHQRLQRLTDNVATLLKVHTEGPRQRFADAASQTQPRDPVWRGVSPGREAAGETESQGPAGREPGSEPAAEKQEETGSHVVHVCEEAPTPKDRLNQATLDPGIHKISDTREDAEPQVDVKGRRSRFGELLTQSAAVLRVGSWKEHVSPAGQGAAQTESGADTGRGGRESQEQKGAAGVPTKAKPPPVPLKRQNTLPPSWKQQQADAPSRGDSFQSQSPVRPELPSGGSGQVGVSPGGRVARPPELQGCAVEVTLDPATAHPRLVLSEDRKSAERGDTRQDLPNNPERFDTCVCVLGSKGFTSGRRYWEVEVGPRRGWSIGVARDSVQRKGRIQLKPDLGIWALDSSEKSQVPRKVGVYLDYEGGQVRFYNAETMALISSRTATFTGRLVPFFHLRAVGSRLSLSPGQR
ncbi:E3 ubiquitin-protein ligase TRIM21-like [Pelodiscus sinensis]|uniref:E3 ubiquitin-protein ligase TRIM21-like n=1 Tax=Pelodiscus sinensis TaxID=13735 RepID=UPI003F6DA1C7